MKARPYTTKTRRKIISRTGPIGSSPNESVSAAVPLHVREMLKKSSEGSGEEPVY